MEFIRIPLSSKELRRTTLDPMDLFQDPICAGGACPHLLCDLGSGALVSGFNYSASYSNGRTQHYAETRSIDSVSVGKIQRVLWLKYYLKYKSQEYLIYRSSIESHEFMGLQCQSWMVLLHRIFDGMRETSLRFVLVGNNSNALIQNSLTPLNWSCYELSGFTNGKCFTIPLYLYKISLNTKALDLLLEFALISEIKKFKPTPTINLKRLINLDPRNMKPYSEESYARRTRCPKGCAVCVVCGAYLPETWKFRCTICTAPRHSGQCMSMHAVVHMTLD